MVAIMKPMGEPARDLTREEALAIIEAAREAGHLPEGFVEERLAAMGGEIRVNTHARVEECTFAGKLESLKKRVLGLAIKEGEPKIHTLYAYIKAEQRMDIRHQINEVLALCTEPLGNMPGAEEVPVTLHVYEREEDLPDAIRGKIRPDSNRALPVAALKKEEGVVYAVLPNTDITEGAGYPFIWALVTDPLLASKIARGNGSSGGNAQVAVICLNKLIEKRPNIRRDGGELSDELYVERL